jgi:hypothetical protein
MIGPSDINKKATNITITMALEYFLKKSSIKGYLSINLTQILLSGCF